MRWYFSIEVEPRSLIIGRHDFYLVVHTDGVSLPFQIERGRPGEISFHWRRYTLHYCNNVVFNARKKAAEICA